jgi:hypothetical protein
VRSLTAIIFLTAFFALQYGKLVSYWQCRVTSLYTSTRCDCVQQLLDKNTNDTQHAAATPVKHEMAYTEIIPELHTPAIFQPPKMLKA